MKPALKRLSLPLSQSFVAKPDDMPVFNPWHYHPEVELVYAHKGHGTRFVGDSVGTLTEGDIMLIGSNLPHTTQRNRLAQGELSDEPPFLVIVQFMPHFLGDSFLQLPECQAIAHLLERAKRGILFTGPERASLGSRLLRMLTLPPTLRLIELLTVLTELAEAEQYQYLAASSFVNTYATLQHQRLHSVYTHSVNHFMHRITIETVADLAHMSVPGFCRYFKNQTGKTYVQYLTELRIAFACKLLTENRLAIHDIAQQCGFHNTSLFNRQFKALKACTPSEYFVRITRGKRE